MAALTFFAGNDKLLLVKKQVDKDTPITDFSAAIALRVYEFTKDPVRTIAPLNETDKSVQQSASHVTAITPSLSWGMYGRASELDLLAEGLLGDNVDGASGGETRHTATPDQEQPYYSIMEYNPYGSTVYDGCKFAAATFQCVDTGDTTLAVTGIQVLSLGFTAHVTPPTLPDPVDELPFIFAEAKIKYAGSHAGTTSQFSWTVNRNSIRAQGDGGFRGLAIVAGKLQNDGQFTRYVADDSYERAVDTGSKTGTVPTADIYTETASVLFDRPADGLGWLITSQKVAYETHQVAIDPANGNPYQEVLGFRTQPEAVLADNVSIVTVNGKATPAG